MKYFTEPLNSPKIIVVGSMHQMYKGIDVLLNSVAIMRQSNVFPEVHVIGDGRYRAELQLLADRLSLGDSVKFLGELSAGDRVRRDLDWADVFVLPSRTEGLPRAMIEAMARGLPCVGTKVGGIPELLSDADLLPVDDAELLAARILEVINDPQQMTAMSERNLERAKDYCDQILQSRRVEMYTRLRDVTKEWLESKGNR